MKSILREGDYEIYEGRESVIKFVQIKQQKEAKNQRLTVVELTERIHDRYWNVEERGDIEKTETFILMLETSLNLIILNFNEKN